MSFLRAEHNLEDKHGLWLIHEPRAPLRPVCDIVAVHGLGGGPASTWRHKETHYLYLNKTQPSYERQSDLPYPETNSTTSFSSYDNRPATSTSYQSFDSNSSGGQSQTPWKSPQQSYTSSRRDTSPSSQRDADLSNRVHMWSIQTPPPPPPDHTRTPSSEFLSPSNQPQHPNWTANTSAARVAPPLRPRPSEYSLNREELDGTNRMTGPAPARKPVPIPPAPPATPPLQDTAYMCDVCLKYFGAKTARFHCTVCDDYDLCPTCYQKDLTSNGHNTTHKMLTISTRDTYNFNDITPAIVIPETTAPMTLPNWTVDSEERRWLHLRTNPSHERYIIHGIATGAYLVQLVMQFKLSSHVSGATLNRLKGESIGEMTVVVGAPIDTSVFFFKDPKTSVSKVNITGELMASGRQFTRKLEIPQHVTDSSQVWEELWDFSATPILLGTEMQASKTSATLAILLQWSDVRKFQTNDNPVLLCTVDNIKMDELLEYDEPTPSPNPPPAQTRSPVTATAEGSDDDDHVTLEELLDATKILVDNNKPVTPENLLTIVMATREVQGEIRRALLLKHIQQVQQQQRVERERKERAATQARLQQAQVQQAAEDFLLLSLLLGSQ